MDVLVIKTVEGRESAHGVRRQRSEVVLIVNGEPLTDIVEAFERARGYEPAGGYGFMSIDALQSPTQRLKGIADDWPDDGEMVLLGCGMCGDEGCWPMVARIDLGDTEVTWTGFCQPHRPGRDYGDLRFAFDKAAYLEQVYSLEVAERRLAVHG